jgi:hypothetical protein
VQIPLAYVRTPDGPYYGNPEQFIPAGEEDYSTRLIVRLTPAEAVVQQGFRWALPWQGGGSCGVIASGEITSQLATWSLYDFQCPKTEDGYCRADNQTGTISCESENPTIPLPVFDGRAAEMRIGDVFYSILVFQPGAREDADPAFHEAVSTFILR